MQKGRGIMGKTGHFHMLVEMLGGPGTEDRGAQRLQKIPEDAAISTNFISGPPCSVTKTPSMRQLSAHLRA